MLGLLKSTLGVSKFISRGEGGGGNARNIPGWGDIHDVSRVHLEEVSHLLLWLCWEAMALKSRHG